MSDQAFAFDYTARQRVGLLTTLGDLKTINADIAPLIENTGSGTFTFANNKTLMSVAAGQYCVRRSKQYYPYFAGSIGLKSY